jgi:hypothetical protein
MIRVEWNYKVHLQFKFPNFYCYDKFLRKFEGFGIKLFYGMLWDFEWFAAI